MSASRAHPWLPTFRGVDLGKPDRVLLIALIKHSQRVAVGHAYNARAKGHCGLGTRTNADEVGGLLRRDPDLVACGDGERRQRDHKHRQS